MLINEPSQPKSLYNHFSKLLLIKKFFKNEICDIIKNHILRCFFLKALLNEYPRHNLRQYTNYLHYKESLLNIFTNL